jgi:hypothetical protein
MQRGVGLVVAVLAIAKAGANSVELRSNEYTINTLWSGGERSVNGGLVACRVCPAWLLADWEVSTWCALRPGHPEAVIVGGDRSYALGGGAVVESRTPDPARNEALAGYLVRADWSPENLGHHLNRLAASLRLPDRLHVKTPRRWVEAIGPKVRPSVPRDPWLGLVCTALSRRLREPVTLADLGWQVPNRAVFVPADDGLEFAWDAPGALASLREAVEADGMDRRRFVIVTGTSLTTFAHDWLFDPARIEAAVQGKRINHDVADDLEQLADIRRRQDDDLGCGAVLRPLREDLRMVIGILHNSSYTEEVGQRLYGVAAELARIAGVQADDSGQQAMAQRLWLAGLRAAHTSGDRSIGANILGFMTRQATELNVELVSGYLTVTQPTEITLYAQMFARLSEIAVYGGRARDLIASTSPPP